MILSYRIPPSPKLGLRVWIYNHQRIRGIYLSDNKYKYISPDILQGIRTPSEYPNFFIYMTRLSGTVITRVLLRYILYTRTVPVLYAYVWTQYRTTKIFAVRTVSKYFTYLRYETKRCIDLLTPRVLDLLA